MFAFHVMMACMEPGKNHERSILLSFAFLARAMRLPDNEYNYVLQSSIDKAGDILNESHERAFGQTAGTYNYHIVGCHLDFLRQNLGSFTDTNAYMFESSYGDLRRNFMPGTRKHIP